MQNRIKKNTQDFDVDILVIGGGSGGVRAARLAAERGARVALVEQGSMGGTCVNAGCIPKKLYSYAAGYAHAFEEASGFGWALPSGHRLDWARLKHRRAGEIDRLNKVYEHILATGGVQVLRGRARLADAQTVVIGTQRITAEHVLVATGASASLPDFPGRELVLTSDAMFELPKVPQRLLVIGGGYIACEFATIYRALGAEVILVHRGAGLLSGFDDDVREFLQVEMAADGIEFRFNATVQQVEAEDGFRIVTLSNGERIVADAVLGATGRRPNTSGLGLDEIGVALTSDGAIEVDSCFQTSVPSVYAVGDVINRVQLTPVALQEATVLMDRLFGSGTLRMDYADVPTAVFTHPSIATAGLSEAQARARFKRVAIYRSTFRALKHTLSGRATRTLMKLVVDADTDRVLGVHMVGEEAGEVVQGFAVAMRAGASKAQFDSTVGIHPTVAEEFVTMRTAVTEPHPDVLVAAG
ncbi:glutathione-disulfide reductase [Cupriavidus sp. WKF15]|uniref:glutathione-disulfide reductase n=1 Tax=Cupriavidus sp. WKF15 TaxID=3032282 RepID=UPI0023E274FE|nr:glutathione-disulfide reductase [Cupriavidus sp. WKF15]WER50869.1 glutathione-disulfide reductase [Cupriavidus sp. WKF15]